MSSHTLMGPDPVLSLDSYRDAQSLTGLLSLLFEPSEPLRTLLVPSVLLRLTASEPPVSTYTALVDICANVAEGWTWDQKADFISGHPMIGEVKGLSALSGKEQGGGTAKLVLDRLAHLNQMYCKVYPGLRYITFVNGRPRAAIVNEMEAVLGLPASPQALPDDFATASPSIDSNEVERKVKSQDSQNWKAECERGLADVWRIAKARLKGLNLE